MPIYKGYFPIYLGIRDIWYPPIQASSEQKYEYYQTGLCLESSGISGRVLDSRPKGRGFEPQRRQCVVSLSKLSTGSLKKGAIRAAHPYYVIYR